MGQQKQLNLPKESDLKTAIDLQIDNLKKVLNDLLNQQHYKVYQILKRILTLRQSQMKDYTPFHLTKEYGIDLNRHQIQYYFGFEYATSESMKLIKSGKLKTSTYLNTVRRTQLMQKPEIQNKIFKKIINEEITPTEVLFVPLSILAGGKDAQDEAVRLAYELTMKLRGLKYYIKGHKKVLTNVKSNNHIKKQAKRLNKIVEKLP